MRVLPLHFEHKSRVLQQSLTQCPPPNYEVPSVLEYSCLILSLTACDALCSPCWANFNPFCKLSFKCILLKRNHWILQSQLNSPILFVCTASFFPRMPYILRPCIYLCIYSYASFPLHRLKLPWGRFFRLSYPLCLVGLLPAWNIIDSQ